jgi:hypothetical protein
MTTPPVHRREEPRAVRAQPRPAGRSRPRGHRARRRSPWEKASAASGSDVMASLVLVMAALAWLVTFYFVLTFVW